jgi:hypothetical protein
MEFDLVASMLEELEGCMGHLIQKEEKIDVIPFAQQL